MPPAEALRRPLSALRSFLTSEASGGIVLIAAAALAMLAANLAATRELYEAILHHATGPVLSSALGPMTVHLWINDGLMAVFFLLVGLEIKRELVDGGLSRPSRRVLPFLAAGAGMAVPALLYLAIAGGTPGLARGWAIPAATDIAFAVGILALLGSRVPPSLKIFLTAVAIVDDMGAVAIIALVYTAGLDWGALAAAVGVVALLAALNRHGEMRVWPYLVGFALLWWLMLRSGVHATVAGVIAALLVPIAPSPGAPDDATSPLHRLEHALSPWVAFGVVPLFAFANAGVSFAGIELETLTHPLVIGIALGLFLGKQLGIAGAILLAERFGLAKRPGGAPWRQVYGIALLAGIGFTMSLFIGQLAFPGDPVLADEVKLGVLGGSLLAAVSGYLLLRFAPSREPPCAASSPPPN
ncbi:Na+/H+ antiporter NhaA [Sphingomonas rubra]|uniref:Na+/H+ antiporter NhaA n=1 Tax=Sphingomonas rubra TaxID=634430 RepID=UPI000B83CAA9|nr:Na+/H+ antiporter NhaA [Sphingomonas rubra]